MATLGNIIMSNQGHHFILVLSVLCLGMYIPFFINNKKNIEYTIILLFLHKNVFLENVFVLSHPKRW